MKHLPALLALSILALSGCAPKETPATSEAPAPPSESAATAPETIDGKPVAGPPRPSSTPAEPVKDSAIAKLGPKAVTTKTGLKYEDLKVGDGAEAKEGKHVTVNYTGWLTDGTQFDSSVGKAPFELDLPGGVIPGWNQGIPGMKVGGKRKLVIPSDLGYGDMGSGPIPGGATLVFEVELLKVD